MRAQGEGHSMKVLDIHDILKTGERLQIRLALLKKTTAEGGHLVYIFSCDYDGDGNHSLGFCMDHLSIEHVEDGYYCRVWELRCNNEPVMLMEGKKLLYDPNSKTL